MITEYNWETSEAVVPVACAATCLGVHPPQPPSDCEDTNGRCEFYRLHPSACGSFGSSGSGVAFDACNDCCYCRYSPGCGSCPPGYRIHQGGTACQECPEGQITNADSTECVDPEPCVASVDCSGHGTTNDLDKSDGCVCSCVDGYSGVDCSTPPPCDADVDCSGNGATTDLDSTDGCVCACDDGYEGVNCGMCPSGPLLAFFQPDMVQWVVTTSGPETNSPTYSSSGSVLSFQPCSSDCGNNIPVLTADIVLPCLVAVVSGSFGQRSTGDNRADDCNEHSGNNHAHDHWNPSITVHDGYVMFGTPYQVIYGGCSYGVNFEDETTIVPRTELVWATNTLRFAGAQSISGETFDIDVDGLMVNSD